MKTSPKKSSKNLTILLGIISFLLLASLYPIWMILDKTSNQQKEKETYLSSFKERQEAFLDLKKHYEDSSQIYEKLYQALPEKKEQSNLVNSLYILENKNGIKITSIKFGENKSSNKNKKETKEKSSPLSQTTKEGDLYNLPIKIEVEGDYQNFYNFIKDLQNNTRYINIDKIKITGVSKELSSKVTATLETNAYLKP